MKSPVIIDVPSRRDKVLALRPPDWQVVAHGRTVKSVIAKAKKAGVKEPVLFFVRQPGKTYIY